MVRDFSEDKDNIPESESESESEIDLVWCAINKYKQFLVTEKTMVGGALHYY